ncbi:hypothetical protein [Baaleninema simplex]|uniref:hypothetical protein n=1 Tax=Baaleninema simplex TaxID=2862350 RepID=UPI00034D512C|nr:hypothetical protein [Baaleninema simplex]
MNNDTNSPNRDRETVEDRFFAWLLRDPTDDLASPPADNEVNVDVTNLDVPEPVGLDAEARPNYQSIDLGDEPTVQDRFQALLKRRFQDQLQDNLPLFPWETEVLEYDTDPVDDRTGVRVPSLLWLKQLQAIDLPVTLPEDVLSELLSRSQQLVQSSLRQGERLMAAVETLFPDREDELNLWTERLLIWSASRSGDKLLASSDAADNFPPSYDAATPTQQMLLSLLAAKEIVETLSLHVSPARPTERRQWLTSHGLLTVEADFRNDGDRPRLYALCQLPEGGRVQLCGDAKLATAQRSDPGDLCVELPDVRCDRIYTLEVRLDASEQSPLVFSICPSV